MGIIIHSFTHDLSKFLPSEFMPYARKFFYGDHTLGFFSVECAFSKAWFLHYHRNKHHWNYWVNSEGYAFEMPKKYALQMIADWKAMSRKFKNDPRIWYKSNKGEMNLHVNTIKFLKAQGFE